ncbi:MAG: hypothetical protein AUK06_00320 [Parcubacteria group bacterium CG2_30_36_18]|uniref:Glycosyltransferase 2-like domain-containing protein n=1 Tax=Candidatus Nealsonbacteria bacterium CG_4_9_14_0_8_um_filter_36_17 TaxID=1974693 RepID=A0A2M8DLM7_9BACT|nr:MAG: hypothetical protein AUK06_00320 [Parcubacteria group bacterium CG2_30_36_18]PJB98653.1 MAG: hypothetical protein CO078_01320 [Candidatus Nealsonbacteria bacterium CG_4_9_14_0_8_um_filter_36_17]
MVKVSIVIPTLNRANLLKFALKSAVEQDYRNLEIVVCDDCSTDNTKEIVESFDNKNIVYVRPDKRLNMSDTLEFGLSKAKGDYITFLTDACYLLSDCISTAMKELERFNSKLAMWKNCGYFSSDWFEVQRKNTLYIPKVTFKNYLLNSKEYLEKFYNNIREPIIPKSINSLCHRSIIDKAIKRQGRFFLYPIPDHTSAASMLFNTPNFVFIDKPLFIGSVSSANIGASQSFNLGKGAQDFLKGFDQKLEDITFLGIYTTSSLIIKGLENVRKFYLDICPEINVRNAIGEIVDSLSKLEIYGTNVNDFWRILNDYITLQHQELKPFILKKKIKSKIKWRMVKIVRSLPYLYNFESLIRNAKILKGDKFKFNNIGEAAKILINKNRGK